MSGSLDNLTLVSHWDADGPPHPLRTLRPGPSERDSRDPLTRLPELASVDDDTLRLGTTLGEGGMGVVRSAVQVSLGREVAVKTVRAGREGPETRRRVLQEGLVTGRLEHPNVVPVYDLRRDPDGNPLIVLKRIEGRPWSAWLEDPDAVRRAFGVTDPHDWHVRVLLQVCNAVAFAHDRGLLHRDLKPDNVMLGNFGEVYVLDWGLAVTLPGSPVPGLPSADDRRTVAGTPSFMAPEQADPTLPLGVATDVWLLGAMLHQIVLGHPPHRPDPALSGDAAVADALAKARAGRVVLEAVGAPELRALLGRALAREASERHPTVEAFRDELRRSLDARQLEVLAGEARGQVEQLLRLLEDPAVDPHGVSAGLGAARFACRRVAERDDVRQDLDRALAAVARRHLREGQWAAAEVLLEERDRPDPELAALVAAARDEERHQLARLHHVEDRRAGIRTRAFLLALMTAVWVVGPVVDGAFGPWDPSYPHLAALSVGMVALGASLAVWARDSLSRSALNRQLQLLLVVAPTCFGLAVLGGWWAGLPPERAESSSLLAFAALGVMQFPTLGWRMAPMTLAYAVAFLVASWRPVWTPFVLAASNLVFVAVTLREGREHLADAWRERPPRWAARWWGPSVPVVGEVRK